MDERTGDLDKMIDTVEETLNESRQLDLLFDVMLRDREQQQQLQREQQQRMNTNGSTSGIREEDDGYRHIPSINDNPLTRHNPLSSVSSSSNASSSRSKHSNNPSVDWQDVLVRAAERGFGECAICMGCNLNTRVCSSSSPGTHKTPSNCV